MRRGPSVHLANSANMGWISVPAFPFHKLGQSDTGHEFLLPFCQHLNDLTEASAIGRKTRALETGPARIPPEYTYTAHNITSGPVLNQDRARRIQTVRVKSGP